ncbi:FRG domain-containing protein [Methylomonas fluvii]|uniref:FRG domain-containing protein n=1 Tax=Methylomonas fluvii TaxID=1854564 RepID=A0ABR9D7R4_9GAMM|nr:FRG domain-containing protein [Methylomonas fluvii]MBD9359146.1 FRG domain-containing protein [Methylomonas fluvii]
MPAPKRTPSQDEIKKSVDSSHTPISNWKDLHGKLESMRDSGWIFRGVSSPTHYLVPSIGREVVYGQYKLAQEQRLFEEFKNRAIALVNDPRFDDWDWLAYAQHIGVPTRLLDWSVNPLVALYFALESDADTDRVIYAVQYSKYIHEVDHRNTSPFANTKEGRFTAPLAFDRIRAQRGMFTIHPHPTKVFHPDGLRSFLLKQSLVKNFRKRLFKYGIDHWHIYPDAHGLGLQLAWQFKNKVGLGSLFV